MELFTICPQCFKESKMPLNSGYGNVVKTSEELDSFLLDYTCENGHTSRQWINAFRFELLFECAMNEYVENRFEAAIYFFGVSKERFYWFFNRLILRRLSENKNIELLFYKLVKNSSQMQEGIYYALYSLVFNECPIKFCDNIQNIRNGIIHKGEFATREDCKKYGEEVLQTIVTIMNKLDDKYQNFYMEELENMKDNIRTSEFGKYEISGSMTMSHNYFLAQNTKVAFDDFASTCIDKKKATSKSSISELNDYVKTQMENK